MDTRFHLLEDKLRIPTYDGLIERPRLEKILERTVRAFPATLITGRTGTGKTALAAGFARTRHASWLRVEPAETDWAAFARYLTAAVSGSEAAERFSADRRAGLSDIARFLYGLLLESEAIPELIVIDDLHHVFDSGWFGDLFSMLICSLPERSRMILISRSRPPAPLWRMRSKQLLGVIDETALACTPNEAVSLFAHAGLSRGAALTAHRREFGRVARLLPPV